MPDLEALNVKLSYPMIFVGLSIALFGVIWLIMRLFRPGTPFFRRITKPCIVVAVGLLLAAAPPIIGKLVPIDLGPRERMVDNERHLTLNKWDRTDYSFLRDKADVVVLQIANADVTDATLDLIANYQKLRELDLDDTQVTDLGLAKVTLLPTLEVLRLTNTKVTAAGVEKHLTNHPSLKVIWLRGTGIGKDTADKVKAGKQGRRVIVE